MATDLSKSSEVQVLDLVNIDNTSALTFSQVEFVSPVPLVDDPSQRNTLVQISSLTNSGYVGSVDVKYDRLDLNGFTTYGPANLVIPVNGSTNDVLNAFNVLYGANLDTSDVDPFNLEGIDYVGINITFNAKATSFAYIGNLDLNVKWPSTELNTVIVDTTFNGLSYPIVPVDQFITFNQPSAQDFGTTPTLSATSTSGLDVSFTSLTPAVCTVTTDGDLSFITLGTCTIEASQEGDEAYLPADEVTRSFAVVAVVPGAPTGVIATPTPLGASVSFTAPAFTGGQSITSYEVTSSPGGIVGTGSASPIAISGLTASVEYTFTVTASNATGEGSSSSPSAAITPLPPEVGPILTGNFSALADAPANVYKASGGIIDGILYVAGGSASGGGTANGNTRRYNIATNTWLSNGTGIDNFIRNGTSVVHNRKLYVMGGASGNTTSSQFNYRYDPDTNAWTALASLPFITRTAGSCVVGNFIYVHGGRNGVSTDVRSLARYDIVNNTWATLASSPAGTGDLLYGLLHRNGKLYSFSSAVNAGFVAVYDIATNTWTNEALASSAGITSSTFPASTTLNNTIYLFSHDRVGYFDLANMRIDRLAAINFGSETAPIAGDDEIYVVGGGVDPNGLRRLT